MNKEPNAAILINLDETGNNDKSLPNNNQIINVHPLSNSIPVRITNRGHLRPNRKEPFQTRKNMLEVLSTMINNLMAGHWGPIMDR
jgi:hypothetical protein